MEPIKNPVIKFFIHEDVAVGETFKGSWDSDGDYIIKYIFIKADGGSTTKSTITIRINNVPITKDKALCNAFGTNPENAIPLSIPFSKGMKFDYEGVNNEAAAADFTVELVMERKG